MTGSDSSYGQEIELKLRVPCADALRAIAVASGGTPLGTVTQLNTLFDTDAHDLHRARFTVRVRHEDGRFSVTAKAPETSGEDGAVATRGEAEIEISEDIGTKLFRGLLCPLALLEAAGPDCAALIQRIRTVVGASPRRPIGHFKNVRERVAVQAAGIEGLVLELDTTTFPNGQVDHELELEIPEGADVSAVRLVVETWLDTAGVEATPSSSKAGRFYAALARTNPSSR
jgi:uncharacterized protein YjbK